MPARAERLYIFPARDGGPGRIMPFPAWWDRGRFFARYRNREIDLGNPIDANFVYIMQTAEALEWNRECIRESGDSPAAAVLQMSEDQRTLELALRQGSWLLVESYEWESGLG